MHVHISPTSRTTPGRRPSILHLATISLVLGLGATADRAAAQCDGETLTAAEAAGGDAQGRAVALSEGWLLAGAPLDDNAAVNAGSVRVFRSIDGVWMQEDTLLAARASSNDQFGSAVAVDGAVAVVGAPFDDPSGNDSGSATVFRRVGEQWVLEQTLTAPAPAAGDRFGAAVAAGGDWIAVGAPDSDPAGSNSGAVHLFLFDGRAWSHGGMLVAADADPVDKFGASLALELEPEGDHGVLAVGAPFDDDLGQNSGAVHVYHLDGGVWSMAQKLVEPAGGADDRLGSSVALSADIIVAGAPFADDGGSSAGSASIFVFEGGAWLSAGALMLESPVAGDQLGHAVAATEETIVLGAPFRDGAGSNAGAAVVWRRDGATWTLGGALLHPDPEADDELGYAVAIEGDVVIAGVHLDDEGGTNSGSVVVFPGLDGVDCDGNGVPDGCEPDCDGDGIPDPCAILEDPGLDCNENGVPDSCDIDVGDAEDCDGNGIPDLCELESGAAPDCNMNGLPDACDIADGDPDFDGNGVPDSCDPDCDGDGIPDFLEILFELKADVDGNGVPDVCEDCNENGIPDPIEIAAGSVEDCDENGVPDSCDVAAEPLLDCNGNGVPDVCDLTDGTSQDVDGDGIPDECQEDCNDNGFSDAFDIASGVSTDCNGNGIPDECDIEAGALDCNENGLPDACDIASGASPDRNGDGVPDECAVDCDGNGVDDSIDLAGGAPDLNGNGILDVCEDCNDNGLPDFAEIALGLAEDCDENGLPDDCDPDCDEDGVPDSCAIADGATDCDENGIPDECEADCNENGVVDSCDLSSGTSVDENEDGIPDECATEPAEDLDGNGVVDGGDLGLLLGAWGTDDPTADLNDDGVVDGADLGAVLGAWGEGEGAAGSD